MFVNGLKAHKTPLPWTMTTSLAVHGAVALALLFRMSAQKTADPIGIEMLYLSEARAPIAKVFKRPAISRQQTAEGLEAEQVSTEQATSVIAQTGSAGVKDGAAVSAIERYKYELRLFLESRKIYPETARRLRQTGKVVLNFKISAAGDLSEIHVEQASASELLNRAALDLVKGAARFKPFPPETQSDELQLSLPIEYIL